MLVVWNPQARSIEDAMAVRAELERRPGTTVRATSSATDAADLAEWGAKRGELVVAAGGDGTINAVVHGLATQRDRSRLAVLPLGTGNDFARTLGLPAE